jgi:cobyrinic acid a,c-diamide synthase
MLTAAGIQLVPFSPLHDQQLPLGVSAVYLGGAAAQLTPWLPHLAANEPCLEALRSFAAAGGLVLGEGAGLIYLSQSVEVGTQRHIMGKGATEGGSSRTCRNGLVLVSCNVLA